MLLYLKGPILPISKTRLTPLRVLPPQPPENRTAIAALTATNSTLLYALTNLLRIFTTNITPTVAPVPADTTPTLLVLLSTRVIASLVLATMVTSTDFSLMVVPDYTPPLPHLIAPYEDDYVTLC